MALGVLVWHADSGAVLMKCAAGWNTVCLLPFQSAGNPVEMKEGWDGAVRRRGFPPLICALYLQPAEPGEIIFQSSSDQASSLIHSFFSCVYLAPSVTRFPCCALLHCSLLPLHLLVANRDQISLEVTRDSFETHNEYTVLFSCRTQTFTSLQT